MKENTRLLILSGVHGNNDGRLGDREDKFVTSCEKQVKNLQKNKSEEIKVKNIKFKVEDVGQIDIKDQSKRELDEDKFVEAVKDFKPEVSESHFFNLETRMRISLIQSRTSRQDREFLTLSLRLRDETEKRSLPISSIETRLRFIIFILSLFCMQFLGGC